MVLIIILAAIVAYLWLARESKRRGIIRQCQRDQVRNLPPSEPASRPQIARASKIKFVDKSARRQINQGEIAGLVDAFTGEPLSLASKLFRCRTCSVCYHEATVQLLSRENGGKCVSCLQNTIGPFEGTKTPGAAPRPEFFPSAVTLETYRKHVGEVITFEGLIRSVQRSRNGQNFGALFEEKGWCDSLKLLIFRSRISQLGGEDFITNLSGRHVRVRGLLQKHTVYGHQIIITERSMIQI